MKEGIEIEVTPLSAKAKHCRKGTRSYACMIIGLCKGYSLGLCLCMKDVHRIYTEYSGIANHGKGQQTL